MNEPALLALSFPRRALRAAILLIAIECLMLAVPSGNWLVTGGLFLWAGSRWWTIRQGWCLTMPLFLNSVFLAALFVFKYSYAPAHFLPTADFANTPLAHEIGSWLVSVQILLLHDAKSLKRIPVALAALGCLVVLCAGDVKLDGTLRTIMLVQTIVFVGCLAWFAHAGRNWMKVDQRRRLRRGILLATLLLAAVPTLFAAQAWHRHERDLEVLLLKMMKAFEGTPTRTRFRTNSALAQVSSGKIFEPEKPVLQVSHPGSEPLYLRGVVLDDYHANGNWIATRSSVWLVSPSEATFEQGLPRNVPLFQIAASDSRQWNTVEVTYLSKDDSIPLALLDTAVMQIGVSQLQLDSLGNVRILNEPLPDGQRLFTPVEPQSDEAPPPKANVCQLPSHLDPRIVKMAEEICHGKTSDTERIRAVEAFFRENYLYQIGFEAPGIVDPVSHFLLHQPRPAAHCEYFASGAALLLRVVGVPTRYVTGYVPSERHSDGSWIARRKDAHAWVEAYDSGLGRWVIVEATPSEGLPERRTATWRNELAQSWRAWSRAIRDFVAIYGTWEAISLVLQSNIARSLLVVILVAAWWALSRRYRRQRLGPSSSSASRVFPFQQWLNELESDLARRGFERLPHETLLRFRDRILASPEGAQLRPTAEWYAAYSATRYNESEQTAERVAELKETWKQLHSIAVPPTV